MAIVKQKGMTFRRIQRCSTSLLALMPAVLAMGLAGAASAADTGTIDEVVITAQHHAQRDKDVAETVSAITPDNLDEFSAGGADITFLNARVPSLYANSSYGRTYPVFSIRGFGDNDFDYNAQQPVSVIYDDVVLLNPILKAFPVFDTAGLQVAKGPQGTLYGTDTPGGVIKIDSQRPTDKFEGYGDVAYGTYNTTSFNGAVNLPLIEGKLALRVSLLEEYRDNWVNNDYAPNTRAQKVNGYNDTAGRIQLLWTPDADTTALLNVHARNMDGTSTLFRANAETPGTNNLAPGYEPNHVAFDDLYTQKLETKGASLNIEHNFGEIKVTSITGWESGRILSRGDLDGGYYNSVTGATNLNTPLSKAAGYDLNSASQDVIPVLEQYTQELRVSNDPNSRFYNQAGAYVFHDLYQDMTYEYEDNTTPGGSVLDNPLGELMNTRQSSVSWGIFDSATFKVDDRLTVQAGLRWSHDYKDLVLERYFIDPNFGASFLIGSETPPGYLKNTARVSGSLMSWDASANYKISDEVSAYVRAARGGKGPAIEARDSFADNISTAKQEVTTSYEGGFKTDLLGKKLRLNMDGYVWNDRDAQITSTGGTNNFILLQNAANVEGYGAEFEATYKPTSNLLLNGGFGWNHTEIQDANLFTTPCGNGCIMTSPIAANGLASLNHSALQNAPLWTANWNARYTVPLTENSDLFAFSDWTYRSNVLTTAYNSVESNVKPLLLGGLRLGYENYSMDLEVSAFVRNIMNTVQVVGVAIDFVPGDSNAYINDPRTFGLEIKKRF